jgi:acetoin utilization deacetylase AcuC-like enzyme
VSGTLLLFDPAMIDHDPGHGHPERPDRLRAVHLALRGAKLPHVRWASPVPVTADRIGLVHEPAHLRRVLDARGRKLVFDAETIACAASVDAALLAAGAVVDAVHEVVTRRATNAFALVRPPGHHAEPGRAMGFCILNNIAIGAATAVDELGCERVLIVDWDVHHGNGTQAAFYDRDDVLLFSAHEWPLFPGTGWLTETGVGAGTGFTVNAPLPAGLGDEGYLAVFESLLEPIAEAYRPDLVMVSAGFDAHDGDPLAGMRMTEAGFVALLRLVMGIADRHAGGRLVLVLEGGYDLAALAASVVACAAALDPGHVPPTTIVPTWDEGELNALRHAHRRHWKL